MKEEQSSQPQVRPEFFERISTLPEPSVVVAMVKGGADEQEKVNAYITLSNELKVKVGVDFSAVCSSGDINAF